MLIHFLIIRWERFVKWGWDVWISTHIIKNQTKKLIWILTSYHNTKINLQTWRIKLQNIFLLECLSAPKRYKICQLLGSLWSLRWHYLPPWSWLQDFINLPMNNSPLKWIWRFIFPLLLDGSSPIFTSMLYCHIKFYIFLKFFIFKKHLLQIVIHLNFTI